MKFLLGYNMKIAIKWGGVIFFWRGNLIRVDYSKCGERGVSLLGGNFLGGGGDTPMHTMAQED